MSKQYEVRLLLCEITTDEPYENKAELHASIANSKPIAIGPRVVEGFNQFRDFKKIHWDDPWTKKEVDLTDAEFLGRKGGNRA